MNYFYVISGSDQGERFTFDSGCSIEIGRAASNALRLSDPSSSRTHAVCEFVPESQSYKLIDLDSKTGTFLNDRPVVSFRLESGDRIRIGSTLMVYSTRQLDQKELNGLSSGDDSFRNIDPHLDTKYDVTNVARYRRTNCSEPLPQESDLSKHLKFLYRVSLVANSSGETDPMLTAMLKLVSEWSKADRAAILIHDPSLETFRQRSVYSHPRIRLEEQGTLQINGKVTEYVRQTESPIRMSEFDSEDQRTEMLGEGVAQGMGVPIRGRNALLGMLYVDQLVSDETESEDESPSSHNDTPLNRKPFDENQLELLTIVCNQIATALENTRYYDSVAEHERVKVVGQTLKGLSHQIKNILQSTNGGKFVIQDGIRRGSVELISRGWEIVDRNQSRISNLVLDMMTYIKPADPVMHVRDLNDAIDECVASFSQRFPKIKVNWSPHPGLTNVRFDSRSIRHALSNILDNLVDLHPCPNNATIQVELFVHQNQVELRIKISELEISTARAATLFDPLVISDEDSAIGISLAVSRKIVREHSGDLVFRVDDQLFSLMLPPDSQNVDESTNDAEWESSA